MQAHLHNFAYYIGTATLMLINSCSNGKQRKKENFFYTCRRYLLVDFLIWSTSVFFFLQNHLLSIWSTLKIIIIIFFRKKFIGVFHNLIFFQWIYWKYIIQTHSLHSYLNLIDSQIFECLAIVIERWCCATFCVIAVTIWNRFWCDLC